MATAGLHGFRAVQARMEAAAAAAAAQQASEPEALDAGEALRRERELIQEERWLARDRENQAAAEEQRLRFEQRRRAEQQRLREEGSGHEAKAHAETASSLSRWLQEEVLSQPSCGGGSSPQPSAFKPAKPPPVETASLPYELLVAQRRMEIRAQAQRAQQQQQQQLLQQQLAASPPLSAEECSNRYQVEVNGQEYVLDNSRLQAGAPGVTLRFSKNLEDRDEETDLVPWGAVIRGLEAGDGWLKVGDRHYLPMTVQGAPILVPYSGDTAEDEDADTKEAPAPPAPDAAKTLREEWRAEEERKIEELRALMREKEEEDLRKEAEEALEAKKAELAAARKLLEEDIARRREERKRNPATKEQEVEDHYSVLGVTRHATEEELTKAYRTLAKQCHPDKASDADKATRLSRQQRMAKLSIAYKVLSSPRQRWQYDRSLAPDAAEGAAASAATAAAAVGTVAVRPAAQAKAKARTDLAEDFDFSGDGDGAPWRLAHGRSQRVCSDCGAMRKERVRLAMAQLRGKEEMKFAINEDDTERYGFEVVRHVGPYTPFGGLSESGASHRLAQPEVRTRFRDFVVGQISTEARGSACPWAETGLRYASLGSGELLFDLELIERLRLAGVRISQVCLIDRLYRQPRVSTRRALREFADWQRCAAQLVGHEPTDILAFGTLADYHKAAGKGGRAEGCHLMVHCDAHWAGAIEDCERLAARALVPGGLLARLTDHPHEPNPPSANKGGALLKPFHGDECADEAPEEPPQSLDDVLCRPEAPFVTGAWTVEALPPECCRLPFLVPIEDPKLQKRWKSRAQRRAEEGAGLTVWRVVHGPRIAVRAAPSPTAPTVEVLCTGDEVVVASEREGAWLRLSTSTWEDPSDAPDPAWVLSDGAAMGLGPLLELVFDPAAAAAADGDEASRRASAVAEVN